MRPRRAGNALGGESGRDLHERFISAYNRIHRHLRELHGQKPEASFGHLLDLHLRQHPRWADARALKTFASLRNVIEHERYDAHEHLFVPSESGVRKIEEIAERLLKPKKVYPEYKREVVAVDVRGTVAEVLRLIHENDFSQFPVYEDGEFRGLVTENGITRWLAHHCATEDSLVDLKEVLVKMLLREEEKRRDVEFIPRDMLLDDLRHLFAENPLLEAAMITQTGSKGEKLLGIATRWDIVAVMA